MAKQIKFLYEQLQLEVGKKPILKIEIPLSIKQNLNPNFVMRPYQTEAFQYFLAFMEEEHDLRKSPAHILFQMATGSGKTMMMAGLILNLYTKGYRNFLFFVNSTTIIDKTKDNFLNGASSKYLFAPQIKIGERVINIVSSDNFEGDTGEDICMIFDTIQGLHSKLTSPRENAITIGDFEDKKIVMIADEAHHLSAETKRGQISMSEGDDLFSWEGAVMKILNSNSDNLLLDFTATAELRNEYVAAKYVDKLLFDYPLSAFRKDGYSKEVEIFKSDSELMERALQSVILSHYRKKLFADMGFDIKPVILFKSKNVEPSKEFMQEFVAKIEILKSSDLEHIKASNTEGVLKKVFDYFTEKKLDFTDLIEELKTDFSKERCISANDDKEKAKLQIQLNTLESAENPIRAVFAVDKLNEGWDVLNLFDIVRLYETRDSGKGKIGKSTAAEAQLIGRGARYQPFAYGDYPRDKRKFDKDLGNDYRICETMYYHSNNDSRYISEITQALIETGIIEDKSIQVRLSLKKSFEDSEIYKRGLIFLNEQKEVELLELGLGAEVVNKIYNVDLFSGKTTTSKVFKDDGDPIENNDAHISKTPKTLKMLDLGKHVIRKAMHQIKGFEFNKLQSKFQKLQSLNQFITDYLPKIQIVVTGNREKVENLTQDDKLRIARQVLKDLHIIDSNEERKFIGTKTFKALPLRSVITEKVVNYSVDTPENHKGMGKDATSSYHDKDILKADWYAFTDCYGTSEEKALVKFMKAKHEELKKEYDEFYLVRNERHFAIYEFEQGRRFEPDFALFLKKKNENEVKHYQIFIEPKGEHLMKEDKWKESFLIRLNDEATVVKTALNKSKEINSHIETFWKDDEFTIWGLPFYNEKDVKKMEFNNALESILK
jgi:type III restriction enzyme